MREIRKKTLCDSHLLPGRPGWAWPGPLAVCLCLPECQSLGSAGIDFILCTEAAWSCLASLSSILYVSVCGLADWQTTAPVTSVSTSTQPEKLLLCCWCLAGELLPVTSKHVTIPTTSVSMTITVTSMSG